MTLSEDGRVWFGAPVFCLEIGNYLLIQAGHMSNFVEIKKKFIYIFFQKTIELFV